MAATMTNPPLILASASHARKNMLKGAGLNFSSIPADIDETSIIESLLRTKSKPEDIALKLAQEKAQHISLKNPDTLVIGSDQILEHEGQIFEKAKDANVARQKLKTLRGKTHRLISAISIAHKGEILWSVCDDARLTMHNFNDDFLDAYIQTAANDLTSCVGAYALEKSGAWLFSDIKGDYFTILGMPLLPLLGYLRKEQGYQP